MAPSRAQSADGAAEPPAFALHRPDDAGRDAVEDFIREIYFRRYGARVRTFMPMLVSLQDAGGIVAAAGWRSAGASPLFLERYLRTPVETLLASEQHGVPARESIVEVGHLAASRAGEGRRLILALGPHLAQQRFQWVVSTLTQELRSLFLRIGVTPLTLGVADPAALGDEAADWGSYYEHRPLVLAGHLPQALRRLAARGRGAAQ
ncbi:thermostable hemolysin [Ramlibacter sp.]|uniref:thermostable hemolysin n=1 Tax=Ramlibacter sp. TaxID=1917967 RepID=UPI003D1067CB